MNAVARIMLYLKVAQFKSTGKLLIGSIAFKYRGESITLKGLTLEAEGAAKDLMVNLVGNMTEDKNHKESWKDQDDGGRKTLTEKIRDLVANLEFDHSAEERYGRIFLRMEELTIKADGRELTISDIELISMGEIAGLVAELRGEVKKNDVNRHENVEYNN